MVVQAFADDFEKEIGNVALQIGETVVRGLSGVGEATAPLPPF